MRWRSAARYLEGEPTIVIMNGKILEQALKKMRIRVSDIMELLRNQGVFDPGQVDFALMEPNGQLSVLKKPAFQPLTPRDMGISPPFEGISTDLIYDGILLEENLRQMNKDKAWLMDQLSKQGIRDVSEVFLATLNDAGSLYIDKYDDHIKKVRDI